MHYYKFNIADYRKDTGHLTHLEHGIYRQLLDTYYLDEEPIKTHSVMRRLSIRTNEEKKAFENVIADFFTVSECGEFYIHARVDDEIEQYKSKADTARANGSKGGRPKKPKKTQPVNSGKAKKTEAKANHKPLTINQELSNKTSTSENKFSDEHMAFAVGMFKLIRQVAPTAKEPNFEKWADDIRLINERDNRSLEEIGKVFRFANSDSFWKTNILSPSKLREKYTELHTKMINQPQKTASIFDLQNKTYVSGDL